MSRIMDAHQQSSSVRRLTTGTGHILPFSIFFWPTTAKQRFLVPYDPPPTIGFASFVSLDHSPSPLDPYLANHPRYMDLRQHRHPYTPWSTVQHSPPPKLYLISCLTTMNGVLLLLIHSAKLVFLSRTVSSFYTF